MGESVKTREITTEPSNGGSPCAQTTESMTCDAGVCPVDCVVSGWSASGTCSRQCAGGEQTYVKNIEQQAAGTGTPCPDASTLVKTEVCNTHACPWAPVGEAGMATGIEIVSGTGAASVQFHMHYATVPAVFFGPAPKTSDAEGYAKVGLADLAFTGVSILQKNVSRVKPACNPVLLQAGVEQPTCSDLGLSPPVKQKPVPVGGAPPGAIDACKCIGPEAGDILFGKNNHQFPTLYGKYCFPWPARDPSAAMAQANGDVKLLYLGGGALGDGWAYNPVTKMRIYVASLVDLTIQKAGEPVIFPEGVGVPDAPDPNAIFPSGEEEWCYVGAECPGAQKDGFHTWMECGKAWDSRPGVPYPNDPETCPILGYDGPKPEIIALTRKNNGDVCVGAKGDNSCNDPSPTGGSMMGFVSSIQMSPNMVMLQRAYNDDAGDTCIFPGGELEKWCKAEGEYGSPTDLGWIMTEGIAGTTPLIGKFNKGSQDSCANTDTGDMTCGVTASATTTTPAKYPVKVGTMGFLLKTQAEAAWSHCHNFEHYHASNEGDAFKYGLVKTKMTKGAWSITGSVTVEGKAPESPIKVAWMAFGQGVYKTASDTIFQVGIAPIVADGEEKTIPLHQEMSTAPIVITQPIGETVVRQREASTTDLYFIGDGDGETVMVQWIAFEPTDSGYFGSVPFVAGLLDGASGEEKSWPEGEFTQPPLVFSSIATARSDGDVTVRIEDNSPESTVFDQEGSQTDEKVAYMAYNGKGQGGAVVQAETEHVQTYHWVTSGSSDECSNEGKSSMSVTCEGSNGKDYDFAFCNAFAGGAEPPGAEPCTGPEVTINVVSAGGSSPEDRVCLEINKDFNGDNLVLKRGCTGHARQRFQFVMHESWGWPKSTKVGLLKSATGNLCLQMAVVGSVSMAACTSGLDYHQIYVDDNNQIRTLANDKICLLADPTNSYVSAVECSHGSSTAEQWEFHTPVLKAKGYGELAASEPSGSEPSCLGLAWYNPKSPVLRESCSWADVVLRHGSDGRVRQYFWTLTMNDELKNDLGGDDMCLTTTGRYGGEWTDTNWGNGGGATGIQIYHPDPVKSPSLMVVKLEGATPQCLDNHRGQNYCSEWCNSYYKFGNDCLKDHTDGDYTCSCQGCNGCYHAIQGHQFGTWGWFTFFDSPGHPSVYTNFYGDRLEWSNNNVWERKTGALAYKPCDGSGGQKWEIAAGHGLRSKAFPDDCLRAWNKEETPYGATLAACAAGDKEIKFHRQPSFVTES
jgi:hypothetical protein